jgi:hypothetical protein
MKIEWNPNKVNRRVEHITVERLADAAKILKRSMKRHLAQRLNTGWGKAKAEGRSQFAITRPAYKSGPYAGANWTSRDSGRLMNSVRVVRKLTPITKALSKKRNVKVKVGHYTAYYADILEFYLPYARPAVAESIPKMKSALGVS